MTKFTDNLWNDIAAEHGATLEKTKRPGPARTRRPGLIASGTLALAVGGTALALGLTSTGGAPAGSTSTAAGGTTITTAAYTITKHSDGSILIKVSQQQSIVAADAKLKSMGINEKVAVFPKPGPAVGNGTKTCSPVDGAPKQPQIQVTLGQNGTEVIKPTAQNEGTGVGTWHLGSCVVFPVNDKGNSGTGNTGTASGKPVAPPVSSVTKNSDGSVLVQVNGPAAFAGAQKKLAAMGIHEQPLTPTDYGPAPVPGPVTCKPAAGVPGPKLKVLLGKNGTADDAGDTIHLSGCFIAAKAK